MRLDKYLVEQKFFSSRARAKEAIERGEVTVKGIVVTSPDADVLDGTEVSIKEPFPWVSRGALKLISALDAFHIDPSGLTALDLGASTGGFTEVLLARGATKVYAVDVGHGQLHPKLLSDSRVVNMEGVDARSLTVGHLSPRASFIVGDLSFISLEKVLPTIKSLIHVGEHAVLLVKPQFEVGRGEAKKGIVKDEIKRKASLDRILRVAELLGLTVSGSIESPVVGGSGNTEYLIHLTLGL